MKKSKLIKRFCVPDEYRNEFSTLNAKNNSVAARILSALLITSVLLTIFYYYAFTSDGWSKGIFEQIMPLNITCLCISAAVFVSLYFINKSKLPLPHVSEAIAFAAAATAIVYAAYSSHLEITVDGIKNINLAIIMFFAIGFFLHFRLVATLALELLLALSVAFFMYVGRHEITNLIPCVVYLTGAYVVSSFAACVFWLMRKDNFVGTKNLELIASYDKLTRIRNRRSFDLYFEQEWHRLCSSGESLALFIIDVDFFKKYNDTYGHQAGDKCLAIVAAVIADSVRKSDFVARYGGEEFVAVLSGINNETAEKIAGKMRKELASREIPHTSSVTQYVTVSIGCMIGKPSRMEHSLSEFIMLADSALYMAKNTGRDRFVINPESESKVFDD
ncbi:MAG: GGDEF domain-containing protein [Defluviitaleaceae bacterium]|nr:GGDEF domain-containing protein [Defluviitaleaceae bacterium]